MLAVQQRDWWLWAAALLITLVLTFGTISFIIPIMHSLSGQIGSLEATSVAMGLLGLVVLFDIYVVYQQFQIHRIRRQLLEREEMFSLITENAADMIAVQDSSGRRLYNSPSYQRILGYPVDSLTGTTALDKIHPDDMKLVVDATDDARLTGISQQIEYRMRDTTGNWHVLESTVTPIAGRDGQDGRVVTVSRDVTDRRRLEEQFRQAQKMEAIGRLSGGIAHDFNNLLGIIIGYAEILQESTAEAHRDRESIDEIMRSSQRAASLTRQLLAFSRQQVLEPKVIDLNVVLLDVKKLLRRVIGEDIELETALESNLKTIKADQGQLEQVLLNLAVNARDAMPQGGKLTISTSNVHMNEIDVQRYSYPFKPGTYVRLTVADTGIGMDAITQSRLFEPFFTTKEKGKGTGLGLATVYGVVKQSDGYIEVHSQVGEGTQFTIYLPTVYAPFEGRIHMRETAPAKGNETILLVEDEAALRRLTKNILEKLGYTVLEAGDGREACQISARREVLIDLLLTDIVMPGMNGRDLANCLLSERPSLKVVYTSGYTGQQIGHGIVPEGSYFLSKPYSRESLAGKIREALQDAPRSETFSLPVDEMEAIHEERE